MKKLYLNLVSLWFLITVIFFSNTSTAQTQVVEVTNLTTGRIWMDRNLGASQAATSSNDTASFGYLYQWGRGSDGHQLRTSGTEGFQSTDINPGHPNFILAPDWITPANDTLWQGISGANNPCPSGFRIPTSAEFADEMATWSPSNGSGAFNSPLKFPLSGYRDYSNGSIGSSWGYYWTSRVDGAGTDVYYYSSSDTGRYAYSRGYGFSVRCIKDEAATGSIPSIGTSTVTNITATTATSGGNITTNGGFEVTVSGLVWSTNTNPTVETNVGITTDGSAMGTFVSNITGLSPNTSYYVRAYATNIVGTAYGNEEFFTTNSLNVGDAYEGGIIAYILQFGDPGYVSGVTGGLIAADTDQSAGIQWYNGAYITTGASGTALGTGNANTNTIVTMQGIGIYAAQLCADLDLGGYSDWYLPSLDEVNKLYINKLLIGGFTNDHYWSSSELGSTSAYSMYFGDGFTNIFLKNGLYKVRAIRSFTTATIPVLSTLEATNISINSATSGGNITSNGGTPVTLSGLVWSTTSNPTVETNEGYTNDGLALGEFTSNLTGLTPNVIYYVRAYATNNMGTGYGNEVSFTTQGLFAGGSGTVADPYQISTAVHLNNVRNYLGSMNAGVQFIQMADIDLDSTQWGEAQGGAGWEPVGYDLTNSFRGIYNGNNHTINGLFINRSTSDNIGLFGYIREASISNLGLTNAKVSGYYYVGSLVGHVDISSTIEGCFGIGTVDGYYYVGGLIGYFSSSNVNNCYSNCNVNGTSYVGGMLGYTSSSFGMYCYSAGTVTGTSTIGGFAGYSSSFAPTSIYWNTETSGLAISAGGAIGAISQEMTSSITFAGWPFSEIWLINEGVTYPYLLWQGTPAAFNYPPQIVSVPTLITTNAKNVTATSATLAGLIQSDGGAAINSCGFNVSTDGGTTWIDYLSGECADTMSYNHTGLVLGNTYWVRAWAQNTEGVGYGEWLTFITQANNDIVTLIELRGKPTDVLLIYTGKASIVAIDYSAINKTSLYIQDSTAAIQIYDANDILKTTYSLYNVVTQITGQLTYFNGMLEFIPTNDIGNPVGNVIIEPRAAAFSNTSTYNQAELTKFTNVTFSAAGGQFVAGQSYIISDGVSTFSLRTRFPEADYIGQTIPNYPVDITGVIIEFNGVAEIAPRFNADIVAHASTLVPVVSTSPVSDISQTTANSGGTVTSDNGATITARGLVWSKNGNPTLEINDGFTTVVGTTGAFISQLTNLTPGTYYYVKAYATNSYGTGYGEELSFTTESFFAGGSGTVEDPYQISTAQHLNNIRSYLGPTNTDVYFSQIANIDLGVTPWNDGEGWEPIGNANEQFFANFNGNGYTISGLTINRPDSNQVALFGWAINASFNNINLLDVNIIGNRSVAALVARLQDNGYLSFCSSSGIVQGQLFSAGLVANAYNQCSIDYCRSNANVQMIEGSSPHQQAGGLVARLISSYINNSYATGNIQGIGSWFGGLAGLVTDNSSISNCYSTGDVTGDDYLGGLLGEISNGALSNCYAVGKVSGQGKGLVGIISETTVANCYWNVETSTQPVSTGGDPKTTLQMISPSTFAAWDFTSIWSINAGATYPYFQWQSAPGTFNYAPNTVPPSNLVATPHDGFITLNWQAPSLGSPTLYNIYRDGLLVTTSTINSYTDIGLTNYTRYNYYITADYSGIESGTSNIIFTFPNTGFSGGTGTAADPYLITNPGELFTVRLYLSSHFKQITYIDLGVYPWNYNEGWEPIGSFSNPFTGTYLGEGNTIDNLTINRPLEEPVGLFGSLNNGSRIEGLNLENVNIVGGNYVGALAGDINRSTLIRISINGAISGTSYVGGISGGNFSNTTLDKCKSVGTVSASGNWSGGITGVNYASRINSSYSSMTVNSSGNSVGGLVGSHEFTSAISNSYALGSVYGNEFVGGIAGWVDSSLVATSYSVGYVYGISKAGGLIGEAVRNSKVTGSFWNTESSGQTTSAGGMGRTNSEMIYPYSNTYFGWDFINIWANDDGFTINNGFPYLLMSDTNIPIVVTNAPKIVTETTAITMGNVILDGGNSIISRGIIWSTSPSPTLESYQGIDVDEGQGIGEFIGELSGLSIGTIYYVKAYATNAMGTGYGNEVSFEQKSLNTTITFNIDMKQPIRGRYFLPESDVVYLTGSFANGILTEWDEPGTGESVVMADTDGDSIYSAIVEFPSNYGAIEYKYFKNAGWNNGDEVTGNRQLTIGTENMSTSDIWIYEVPVKTGVIKATASAPTIDGIVDDLWLKVEKNAIDRVQPGQFVSFTEGMPTWQACWDANYTYVLVTVPDDNVYNHIEAGVEPWLADRPELYFDVNTIKVEDPPLGPLSPGTGHFQFAPDFTSMDFPPGNHQVAFTIDGNDAGYIFEYAIPHNTMYDLNGYTFSPYDGLVVGFDISVLDLDEPEKGSNIELGRVDWSNDMIATQSSWYDMTKSGDVTYSGQLIGNTPTIISCNHENVTSNSANLVAVVNANDSYTELVFEYGTTTEMLLSMYPSPSSINGINNETIVGDLLGLEPNQTYYYSLRATNAIGVTNSVRQSFRTTDDGGLISISGKSRVCLGQRNVEYGISGSFNSPYWTVSNGTITSGQGNNTIQVNWNNSGESGKVAVEAQLGSSMYNDDFDVSFDGSISLAEPTIHVKGPGKANILICTTPNAATYQWYKDSEEMSGETKQYYVAKNNFGVYTVEISDNSGCRAMSPLKQISNTKNMNLYPNPATNKTTLTYETEETGSTLLRIVDVYGKTVKQMEWDKTGFMLLEEIPLNNLEKGVYIIEIAVEGITKENQRLLIN